MSAAENQVKQELQQMAEQPQPGESLSSDDSNDHQDFWSSLGDEFDGGMSTEEQSAEPEEVREQPEPSAPPVETEVNAPPSEEAQPPAPAQQEAQPEQQQFDPEQARLATEKWQKDLETFYSDGLGEDFDSEFLQSPKQHLSKLMAQATQVAIKNAFEIYQRQLPQLEQRMIQNSQGVIDATIAKRSFYRKFPALRSHESEFDKFFAKYRTIADPNTSVEQQASEAAQVFMSRRGLKQNPQQTQQSASAPPPPPPVKSGAAPTAPKQSDNPWQAYADELANDDDLF
jgi:hypothetical protein